MEINLSNKSELDINLLELGQKIHGQIIGFKPTPKGWVGIFNTNFGRTTAFLGKKTDWTISKLLELKGKECWLFYRGSFESNKQIFPNFNILWI
jgi:hypothetical protein